MEPSEPTLGPNKKSVNELRAKIGLVEHCVYEMAEGLSQFKIAVDSARNVETLRTVFRKFYLVFARKNFCLQYSIGKGFIAGWHTSTPVTD